MTVSSCVFHSSIAEHYLSVSIFPQYYSNDNFNNLEIKKIIRVQKGTFDLYVFNKIYCIFVMLVGVTLNSESQGLQRSLTTWRAMRRTER
jgi:hypothetical protein